MADQPLKLDSVVLRAVAEDAASHRLPGGEPGFMVTTFSREEGWSTEFTRDPVPPREDRVVTPVNTRILSPQRLPVVSVKIQAQGMEEGRELVPDYDAVFWSEAAVEKFVIPYYASKGQWLAAYVLETLSRVFYGYVPQPPLFTPGDPGQPRQEEPVPFALAHLPRSDYVGLSEFAPLGSDLDVLWFREGTVVAERLSSYFHQPEARP